MAVGRFAMATLALAAVSTPAAERVARAEVFSGPPAVCAQRVTSLEGLFRDAAKRPDTTALLPTTGFEAPTLKAGTDPGRLTAIVESGPSGTRFDGRPVEAGKTDGVAQAAAIAREIETAQEGWRLMHPKETAPRPRLGLWLERRGSAFDAWTLIESLSRKADVLLLGAVKDSARPGRQLPPSVSKQMETIRATTDAAQKTALISQATKQSLAGCAGHEQYFDVANRSYAQFRQASISALKGCRCAGADLDLLEAIAVPELDLPLVTSRPVRPQAKAKATLTLARSATIQDLLDRLPTSGPSSVRWGE